MKNDFVSSGRSVSDLKAHLVLTTKYRCKVLTGEMLQRLTDVVIDLCEKWNCKMIEFNGEADHIHLLFQYYPQLELPKFISNIKSVSSRRLRSEFADQVWRFYRKPVLWNESYFIASCGGVTVSVLKRYIEQQDSPHPTVDGASSPIDSPASHPDTHPVG
jgi:putative transposase